MEYLNILPDATSNEEWWLVLLVFFSKIDLSSHFWYFPFYN